MDSEPFYSSSSKSFRSLLQLLVRQHFLELAPGSLAFLALVAHPLIHPVEQPVVIGTVLGGRTQEFIFEIGISLLSRSGIDAEILN